mmetsp:Transcript_34194/g.33399  ORF Transcript_34194/g.33399 Transcript_34194/m.33399 type:complete len:142 (+) Transcript_34194:926-1351(+)
MQQSGFDNCPFEVTMETAYASLIEKEETGLMNCFCSEQYQNDVDVSQIAFPNNLFYCADWLKLYYRSNALVWAVSLTINCLNVVLTATLRYISKYERAHSKTSETLSAMLKLFIVSYVNTGVIIFAVNANFGFVIPHFPIF